MLASFVAALSRFATPWQNFYSDSALAETAVTSLHIVALMVGGGLAIAADRATLRAAAGDTTARDRILSDLHGVHRPVLIALGVLFVSGTGLALADVKTFAESPTFLVKLALVALLCLNGAFLYRTESQLRREPTTRHWRRLRLSSWCSLGLWTATVVVGTALLNV